MDKVAQRRETYKHVKKWRATMKQRLVMSFGWACAICGLHDDPIVYDFHHINPEEKDGLITSKIRSWERVVLEARKCAMLCSHCHRKVHAGIVSLPTVTPTLDTSVLIGTDFEIGTGPSYNDCPVCGTKKPISQTTCSNSCAGSLRASGKRPVDMDALLEDIIKNGCWPVARRIGVSDNTLRKWLKKANLELPSLPKGPRPHR